VRVHCQLRLSVVVSCWQSLEASALQESSSRPFEMFGTQIQIANTGVSAKTSPPIATKHLASPDAGATMQGLALKQDVVPASAGAHWSAADDTRKVAAKDGVFGHDQMSGPELIRSVPVRNQPNPGSRTPMIGWAREGTDRRWRPRTKNSRVSDLMSLYHGTSISLLFSNDEDYQVCILIFYPALPSAVA
jgi:hypothetical protein